MSSTTGVEKRKRFEREEGGRGKRWRLRICDVDLREVKIQGKRKAHNWSYPPLANKPIDVSGDQARAGAREGVNGKSERDTSVGDPRQERTTTP